MSDNLEQRVRKLENRLIYLTGFAVAAGVFLGITWQSIGSAVDRAFEEEVDKETIERINSAAAKADSILKAAEAHGVMSTLRWETLKAERITEANTAGDLDASIIYEGALNTNCFAVGFQLPTQDENTHWPAGMGDALVFGNTYQVHDANHSPNHFQRHQAGAGRLSPEFIRLFSVANWLRPSRPEPVDVPDTVFFRALLACPDAPLFESPQP